MSEVLITLGIIGVIASIVIPTVVGKVNEHVRKTQFKRAYTLFASAVQKLEEDKGYIQCNYGTGGSWVGCSDFFKEVGAYLKPIKYCENNAVENGCLPNPSYMGIDEALLTRRPDAQDVENYINNCGGFTRSRIESRSKAYVLGDGSILFSYESGDAVTGNTASLFAVDINGFKAPNKWGYDVFVFDLYRQSASAGLQVRPFSASCHPVEKGGKNARDFFTSI